MNERPVIVPSAMLYRTGGLTLVTAWLFGALVWFFATTAVGDASDTDAAQQQEEYQYFETRSMTPIFRVPGRRRTVIGKIFPGAILKLRPVDARRRCKDGWFEREEGGYICGDDLRKTDELAQRPAARDLPDVTEGAHPVQLTRGGARLYRSRREIDRREPYTRLKADSILMVQDHFRMYGTNYYQTRQGWAIEDRHLEDLPDAPRRLGRLVENHRGLSAIVIDEAPTYLLPDLEHPVVSKLERWQGLSGELLGLTNDDGGWIQLPSGEYVPDKYLARIRSLPVPESLEPGEKWIAIDLAEQLVHAYEGERLVWVAPCSTGIRNNTRRGSYRIQWKRRMQTLQLRAGHLRVEDVQWVMYYDRKNNIAIHTAYWHDSFGHKHSHGCVNLPVDDARWIFEWSAPHLFPVDSERYANRDEQGTRVVVF